MSYWQRNGQLIAVSGALLWIILGAATGHHNMLTGQSAVYFEKAQRYHIVHMLALLWLSSQPVYRPWVAYLWGFGVLCFSGSLYLMSLTALSLNLIVPIGGIGMLSGWGVLLYQLWRRK